MSPATEPTAAHPPSSAIPADSAGVPWAGRRFEQTAHPADDGSAPAALVEALERFARREAGEEHVVDALRSSRLLVPLVATLGETGTAASGLTVDKSAELALVTVSGPDGRRVLPVFGSVDTMRTWNPDARPVPVDAVRAALAAASEDTELMVLDPASPSEFVVRRPALWAIAQDRPWIPGHRDPSVLVAFERSLAGEPHAVAVALVAGDPRARLQGPEVVARIAVRPGLTQADLDGLLGRLQERWTADPTIAARVDSLGVTLVRAEVR
jgi:hypothetical protein